MAASRKTASTTTQPATVPSGYSTHDTYFASRFRQGGRVVYSLDLSPLQLINLVTRPNPDVLLETNRAIRPKHAEGFADYFRMHDTWVIPGLILRTPSTFTFDVQYEVSGTQFGILEVSRMQARDINILDGQHRILGFFIASDKIAVDMDKARNALQVAKRTDPGGAAVRYANDEIKRLESQLKRLETERVAIQLFVEEDPVAYRQMFFDISDNALGITASVRARFDSRKVVNRALPLILEHPLLVSRVDMEVDRVSRKSSNLMTAKNVAEVAKSVKVGFSGRVSRRMDIEMKEDQVAKDVKSFFDGLTEAFPPLKAIQLGQVTANDLRATSLLGAPSFIRILAGVYHDLMLPHEHAWKRDMVIDFFKKLAPHVSSDGAPVYPGSIWLEHMPDGVFTSGSATPSGRRQDLQTAHDKIVDWALDRVAFLDAPPAPRPAPRTEEDELLALELEYAAQEAAELETNGKK